MGKRSQIEARRQRVVCLLARGALRAATHQRETDQVPPPPEKDSDRQTTSPTSPTTKETDQ